jgi:LemA protein
MPNNPGRVMSGNAAERIILACRKLPPASSIARMAWAGLIVALAVLAWAAIVFNLLVRDRNRVAQGWSDVDVQLERRHDLVPRLAEVVRGYAGYERALLTSLAELRGRGHAETHPAARGAVESDVGQGVHALVALVEAYPDLKASGHFLELQKQLADTENQIQFARRYYNGAVNLYNTRIQRFPDLLIAGLFGFGTAELFELDDARAASVPGVSPT